jgi:hypothetical protein
LLPAVAVDIKMQKQVSREIGSPNHAATLDAVKEKQMPGWHPDVIEDREEQLLLTGDTPQRIPL